MTIVADPFISWGLENGQIKDILHFKPATVMGPAITYSKLAPTGSTGATGGVAFANGPTRWLIADAAGNFTGFDAFNNLVTGMPVVAGKNEISISALVSLTGPTGGLSQLWGVW